MVLKLHMKLAPGWALIQVNFDPIQEIGPKVGGGRSFMSGPFFCETMVLTKEFAWDLFFKVGETISLEESPSEYW